MVMTVEPGFGGQSFIETTMPKLRSLADAVAKSPYEAGPAELDPVLAALDLSSLLRAGFTVVVSRGSKSSNGVIPLHWEAARRLSYGDSVVSVFRSRVPPGTPGDMPGNVEV